MQLEKIRHRVDRLEESMGARDVPRPHIVLVYVHAADGWPTGEITIVEDGRPDRTEWRDPEEIRAGALRQKGG
jgi:hypothetical protein